MESTLTTIIHIPHICRSDVTHIIHVQLILLHTPPRIGGVIGRGEEKRRGHAGNEVVFDLLPSFGIIGVRGEIGLLRDDELWMLLKRKLLLSLVSDRVVTRLHPNQLLNHRGGPKLTRIEHIHELYTGKWVRHILAEVIGEFLFILEEIIPGYHPIPAHWIGGTGAGEEFLHRNFGGLVVGFFI